MLSFEGCPYCMGDLSDEELKALSVINRIALNQFEMDELLEATKEAE